MSYLNQKLQRAMRGGDAGGMQEVASQASRFGSRDIMRQAERGLRDYNKAQERAQKELVRAQRDAQRQADRQARETERAARQQERDLKGDAVAFFTRGTGTSRTVIPITAPSGGVMKKWGKSGVLWDSNTGLPYAMDAKTGAMAQIDVDKDGKLVSKDGHMYKVVEGLPWKHVGFDPEKVGNNPALAKELAAKTADAKREADQASDKASATRKLISDNEKAIRALEKEQYRASGDDHKRIQGEIDQIQGKNKGLRERVELEQIDAHKKAAYRQEVESANDQRIADDLASRQARAYQGDPKGGLGLQSALDRAANSQQASSSYNTDPVAAIMGAMADRGLAAASNLAPVNLQIADSITNAWNANQKARTDAKIDAWGRNKSLEQTNSLLAKMDASGTYKLTGKNEKGVPTGLLHDPNASPELKSKIQDFVNKTGITEIPRSWMTPEAQEYRANAGQFGLYDVKLPQNFVLSKGAISTTPDEQAKIWGIPMPWNAKGKPLDVGTYQFDRNGVPFIELNKDNRLSPSQLSGDPLNGVKEYLPMPGDWVHQFIPKDPSSVPTFKDLDANTRKSLMADYNKELSGFEQTAKDAWAGQKMDAERFNDTLTRWTVATPAERQEMIAELDPSQKNVKASDRRLNTRAMFEAGMISAQEGRLLERAFYGTDPVMPAVDEAWEDWQKNTPAGKQYIEKLGRITNSKSALDTLGSLLAPYTMGGSKLASSSFLSSEASARASRLTADARQNFLSEYFDDNRTRVDFTDASFSATRDRALKDVPVSTWLNQGFWDIADSSGSMVGLLQGTGAILANAIYNTLTRPFIEGGGNLISEEELELIMQQTAVSVRNMSAAYADRIEPIKNLRFMTSLAGLYFQAKAGTFAVDDAAKDVWTGSVAGNLNRSWDAWISDVDSGKLTPEKQKAHEEKITRLTREFDALRGNASGWTNALGLGYIAGHRFEHENSFSDPRSAMAQFAAAYQQTRDPRLAEQARAASFSNQAELEIQRAAADYATMNGAINENTFMGGFQSAIRGGFVAPLTEQAMELGYNLAGFASGGILFGAKAMGAATRIGSNLNKAANAITSLGRAGDQLGDSWRKLGRVESTPGISLTQGQRVWNKSVDIGKQGLVSSGGEFFQEGIQAFGEAGATFGDAINQGIHGAILGVGMGPVHAFGGAAVSQGYNAGKQILIERAQTKALTQFVESYNKHNNTGTQLTLDVARQAQTYQRPQFVAALNAQRKDLMIRLVDVNTQLNSLPADPQVRPGAAPFTPNPQRQQLLSEKARIENSLTANLLDTAAVSEISITTAREINALPPGQREVVDAALRAANGVPLSVSQESTLFNHKTPSGKPAAYTYGEDIVLTDEFREEIKQVAPETAKAPELRKTQSERDAELRAKYGGVFRDQGGQQVFVADKKPAVPVQPAAPSTPATPPLRIDTSNMVPPGQQQTAPDAPASPTAPEPTAPTPDASVPTGNLQVSPSLRLAELQSKAEGTPERQITLPDGSQSTSPARPPQPLTPAEQQELTQLQAQLQTPAAPTPAAGPQVPAPMPVTDPAPQGEAPAAPAPITPAPAATAETTPEAAPPPLPAPDVFTQPVNRGTALLMLQTAAPWVSSSPNVVFARRFYATADGRRVVDDKAFQAMSRSERAKFKPVPSPMFAKNGKVYIDESALTSYLQTISPENRQEKIQAALREEIAHLATLKVRTEQQIIDDWRGLPDEAKRRVIETYFTAELEAAGGDWTKVKVSKYNAGAEFWRMYLSALSEGRTTEQVDMANEVATYAARNPLFAQRLKQALEDIARWLREEFITLLDPDSRARYEQAASDIDAEVAKLDAMLGITPQPSTPAAEAASPMAAAVPQANAPPASAATPAETIDTPAAPLTRLPKKAAPQNQAFIPKPAVGAKKWTDAAITNLLSSVGAAFGYKIVKTDIDIGIRDNWGNGVTLGTQLYDKTKEGSDVGQWIDAMNPAVNPVGNEIIKNASNIGLHRVWYGHDFAANVGDVVDKFGWIGVPKLLGALWSDSMTTSGIPLPGTQFLVHADVVGDKAATEWLSINIGEVVGLGAGFLGTYMLHRAAKSGRLSKPRVIFATIGISIKLISGVMTAQPFLILSGLADTAILITNLDQVKAAFKKGIQEFNKKPQAVRDLFERVAPPTGAAPISNQQDGQEVKLPGSYPGDLGANPSPATLSPPIASVEATPPPLPPEMTTDVIPAEPAPPPLPPEPADQTAAPVPPTIKMAQAAKTLGVTPKELLRLVKAAVISAEKSGNNYLFTQEALDTYTADRAAKQAPILEKLAAVAGNTATEADIADLRQRGLVDIYRGERVINQKGYNLMDEAGIAPRLNRNQRVQEIDDQLGPVQVDDASDIPLNPRVTRQGLLYIVRAPMGGIPAQIPITSERQAREQANAAAEQFDAREAELAALQQEQEQQAEPETMDLQPSETDAPLVPQFYNLLVSALRDYNSLRERGDATPESADRLVTQALAIARRLGMEDLHPGTLFLRLGRLPAGPLTRSQATLIDAVHDIMQDGTRDIAPADLNLKSGIASPAGFTSRDSSPLSWGQLIQLGALRANPRPDGSLRVTMGNTPEQIKSNAERAELEAMQQEYLDDLRGDIEEIGGLEGAGVGRELLSAIESFGGIPDPNGKNASNFRGELKTLKEYAQAAARAITTAVKGTYKSTPITVSRIFRKDAPDLDSVAEMLRGHGFDTFGPDDVVNLLQQRFTKKSPMYGTTASFDDGMGDRAVAAKPRVQLANASVTTEAGPIFLKKAHHGTPHKVDRFSLEKIGTGEGAQVYGWGLYFAERQKVAEEYRKTLGGEHRLDGEIFIKGGMFGPAARQIYNTLGEEAGDILVAFIGSGKERVLEELNNPYNLIDQATRDRVLDLLDRIESTNPGNTYTVELDVNDADLLDWDKPLSEQSEKVKAALLKAAELDGTPELGDSVIRAIKAGRSSAQGDTIYHAFNRVIGSPQNATRVLREFGIKGIRYLDQGSRSEGQGTYNYVIFDENLIRIVAENGETLGNAGILMAKPTAAQRKAAKEFTEKNGSKPADKAAESVADTLAQVTLPFRQAPYQLDLFARTEPENAPREVEVDEYDELERQAFANNDLTALSKVVAKRGRASAILPELVEGGIPYWNPVGTRIESPADFAALMLPIRSPYQEMMKVAVLDDNLNIVSAQIITVGSVSETIGSPGLLLGYLSRLRHSSGVKYDKIIISHNHPGGDPEPSPADNRVQRAYEDISKRLGYNVVDHIITNGKSFYSYKEQAVTEITPTLAPWEKASVSDAPQTTTTEKLAAIAKELRQGNKNAVHVIHQNVRLRVLAVEQISYNQMTNAKELLQNIFESGSRYGTSFVSLAVPTAERGVWPSPGSNSIRAAKYLSDNLEQTGISLIDVITIGEDGHFSLKDTGIALAGVGETPGLFAKPRRQLATGGFYLKSAEVINSKIQGKQASLEQVKALLENPQNGIKAEELKWTGVVQEAERLAKENNGKVPKEDLLAFLAADGAVELREVTRSKDSALREEARQDLIDNGIENPTEIEITEQLEEFWPDYDDGGRNIGAEYESPDLILPGGENYRNVVLAMPHEERYKIKELPDGYATKKKNGRWWVTTAETDQFVGTGTTEQEAVRDALRILNEVRGKTRNIDPAYRSSHFPDVPNYVAHMRLNERTDADGNRVLHSEEYQSDRHQAGKKEGYLTQKPTLEDARQTFGIAQAEWDAMPQEQRAAYLQELQEGGEHLKGRIPDAPFRQSSAWGLTLVKRQLRDAVEGGFDGITWTTGETQAERYNLSKQVGEIRHWEAEDSGYYGVQVIDPNEETIMHEDEYISASKLADLVGKDVAQRIIDREGEDIGNNSKSLSGDGLKVGGSGMKAYYDQIMPKEVQRYVKQWGGKVEKAAIMHEPDGKTLSDPEASERIALNEFGEMETPIWRVLITPQMRESVEDGQTLFAKPRSSAPSSSLPGNYPDTLDIVIRSTKVAKLRLAGLKEGEATVPLDPTPTRPGRQPDLTPVSPLYKAAKHGGDPSAALEISEMFVNQKMVDELQSRLDSERPVIFVPVRHSDPGLRHNALPAALATSLKARILNSTVDSSIVKTGGMSNTSVSTAQRMSNNQEFDGGVDTDAQYVVVDDVFTSGNTLTALINHIVRAGGEVVAATAIADSQSQNYLKPRQQDIAKLLDRAGLTSETFQRDIGFPIEALTGSEIYRIANLERNWRGPAFIKERFRNRSGVFAARSLLGAERTGQVDGQATLFAKPARSRGDLIPNLNALPEGVTAFSGAGLVEIGLQGIVQPTFAVEYNPAIAQAYRAAWGDHVQVADIRSVSMEAHKGKFHYHASPVCKNSSLLKSAAKGGGEKDLDIDSARAVALHIRQIEPQVVTIENVPDYRNTIAAQIIRDALEEQGYTYDEGVYNAADYGAPTARRRYLLRAVKGAAILPEPTPVRGPGWLETVKDIIDDLPDTSIARANYIKRSLPEQGIDLNDIQEPLLVSGTTLFKKVAFSRPTQPAFTFKATPATVDRILLPDGRVKRVTAKAKARMTGVPDSFPLPTDEKVALTIIGNGVPPALVRNVFGPVIEYARARQEQLPVFAKARPMRDTTAELFGDETPFNLVGETLLPTAAAQADTVVDAQARVQAFRQSGREDVGDLFGEPAPATQATPERIAATAVIDKDGTVLSSPAKTHAELMEETKFDLDGGEFPPTQNFGFVTTTGRFVEQKEAQQIAQRARQVEGNQPISGEIVTELQREGLLDPAQDIPSPAMSGRRSEGAAAPSAISPVATEFGFTREIDPPIEKLKKDMVRFASGMSGLSDLGTSTYVRGGMQNYGVGFDVGLLSKNAIDLLANAVVNLDTQVFIDSGAFSHFIKSQKAEEKGITLKPLSFDKIFEKYDSILEAIQKENAVEADYPRPLVVMPDIIGNQKASLLLTEKYKDRIAVETAMQAYTPIIPIPLGELSLSQAYNKILEILNSNSKGVEIDPSQFIVGIPSNAQAVSREKLAEFLKESKPPRIHFLGAAADININPLLAVVSKNSPDTLVTADASKVRSEILNGVAAGKTREQAITEALFQEDDPSAVLESFNQEVLSIENALPEQMAIPAVVETTAQQSLFTEPDTEQGTLFAKPRVTPQQNSEYLDLAKDPEANREQLQEMVNEAAKKAGMIKLWHGSFTEDDFDTFDPDKSDSRNESSFFAFGTPVRKAAHVYAHEVQKGGKIKRFFFDASNILSLDDAESAILEASDGSLTRELGISSDAWQRGEFSGFALRRFEGKLLPSWEWNEVLREKAEEVGATSFVTWDGAHNAVSLGVLSANQIKSADPVTYDSAGAVIPLSERFNPESDSILFAKPRPSSLLAETKGKVVAGTAVGTRNPTGKAAQEAGTDRSALVDLASMRRDPELFRKNAVLLADFPLVAGQVPEAAKLVRDISGPLKQAREQFLDASKRLEDARNELKAELARRQGVRPNKIKVAEVDKLESGESKVKRTDAVVKAALQKIKDARKIQDAFRDKRDKRLEEFNANSKALLAGDQFPIELADRVYAALKTAAKRNLELLIELFPSDLRDTARLWYDGANIIAQDFATRYNTTLNRSAAVLAVFSPQKDWFMNVALGQRMMNIWANHQNTRFDDAMAKQYLMRAGEPEPQWDKKTDDYKRDAKGDLVYTKGAKPIRDEEGNISGWENWDNEKAQAKFEEAKLELAMMRGKKLSELPLDLQARFIRMWSEVYDAPSFPVVTPAGTFSNNKLSEKGNEQRLAWGSYVTIEKAIAILTAPAASEMQVISNKLGVQHKVRSFYNNIVDPANPDKHVTMDTHAIAAILWQALSGNSPEVSMNFGGGGASGNSNLGVSGLYAAFAEAYREVAADFGLLPREVQSITWESVRLLFPAKFKSQKANVAKVREVWDQHEQGTITTQQAHDRIFQIVDEWKRRNSLAGQPGRTASDAIGDREGVGRPDWAEVARSGDNNSQLSQAAADAGGLPERGRRRDGTGRSTVGRRSAGRDAGLLPATPKGRQSGAVLGAKPRRTPPPLPPMEKRIEASIESIKRWNNTLRAAEERPAGTSIRKLSAEIRDAMPLGFYMFYMNFLRGRLDRADALAPGIKRLIQKANQEEQLVQLGLAAVVDGLRNELKKSFGDPAFWNKNRARLKEATRMLLPVASYLQPERAGVDGGFVWREFERRSGTISQMEATKLNLKDGELFVYEGRTFRLGEYIPEWQAFTLLEPVSVEMQEAIYEEFFYTFPEALPILDRWITPELADAFVVGPGSTLSVEFNREALLGYYNTWPKDLLETLEGVFEPVPRVEGYTPDIAAQKGLVNVIANLLGKSKSPGRKFKSGALRESGKVQNLIDAFSTRAMQAHREKIRLRMREGIIEKAVVPRMSIPEENMGDYISLENTFSDLVTAVETSRYLDPKAYPSLSKALNPKDQTQLMKLVGDAARLRAGEMMIHKKVHDELMMSMAREQTEGKIYNILNWVLRAVKLSLLTVGSGQINWIGNQIQRWVQTYNTFLFSAFALMLGEKRGAKRGMYNFLYLLRGLVTDNMPNSFFNRERIGGLIPYQVFEELTLLGSTDQENAVGSIVEDVYRKGFVKGISSGVKQALKDGAVPGTVLYLINYSGGDVAVKQTTVYAAMQARAAVAADELGIKKNRTEWKRKWITKQINEFSKEWEQALAMSGLFYMDYKNVPTPIAPETTIIPANAPHGAIGPKALKLWKAHGFIFMKWGYNWLRFGKRMSIDSVLTSVSPDSTKEERAQAFANLATLTTIAFLGSWLLQPGDDEEFEEVIGSRIGEDGKLRERHEDTSGRMNLSAFGRNLKKSNIGKSFVGDGIGWAVDKVGIGQLTQGMLKMLGLTVNADFTNHRGDDYWMWYRNIMWLPELFMAGKLVNGDLTGFLRDSGPYIADMASLGVLSKIGGVTQASSQDANKEPINLITEAVFDVVTAPIAPPQMVKYINALIDPTIRRRTDNEQLGFDMTPLTTIQSKIPGLTKNLPPAGRPILPVLFSQNYNEQAAYQNALKNLNKRKDITGEQRDKEREKINEEFRRRNALKTGNDLREVMFSMGLDPSKAVNRPTTRDVLSDLIELQAKGAGPSSVRVYQEKLKDGSVQPYMVYVDPESIPTRDRGLSLIKIFAGPNVRPFPKPRKKKVEEPTLTPDFMFGGDEKQVNLTLPRQ